MQSLVQKKLYQNKFGFTWDSYVTKYMEHSVTASMKLKWKSLEKVNKFWLMNETFKTFQK